MVERMSTALNSAYEQAVGAETKLAEGGDAAVRSALAKLIIKLAMDGERDSARLARLAVERFRQAHS
jgi:hypothetical protein